MTATVLTESDQNVLEKRGISEDEARRQLKLLTRPATYIDLVRPCTVGQGIERIDDSTKPALIQAHEEAARAGRFIKLVPASGAASRMFKDLFYFQRGPGREKTWTEIEMEAGNGDAAATALRTFLDRRRSFAFFDDLERRLSNGGEQLKGLVRAGAFQPVLDALLGADGMGYGDLPKGLLKFHAYGDRNRTSFEEHLVEAAEYVKDTEGNCRLHFTVSPEHRAGFEALFVLVESDYRRRFEARFEVGYSVQKPSTDTLALDADGMPLRDEGGELRLRPGGHGALIENLNELGADLAYIKNIDNVQPDHLKGPTLEWKKLLGGFLARLQQQAETYLKRLRLPDPSDPVVDEALQFVQARLHVEFNGATEPTTPQAKRAFLIRQLNRPLRVCGVVPNTGEPGGGPFWVRGADGRLSLQIVEGAQVNPEDAEQQKILRSSTHFNPVDLVCAVRDVEGRPFDLHDFIDHEAVIVTAKSEAGRALKALERPGLWNGAMAGWNTVFVEVPLETFSPVKTVLDLLRPEHQPAS